MKKMKRLLTTLFLALISFVAAAQNDTTSTSVSHNTPTLSSKDTLLLKQLYDLVSQANASVVPRFKLYKTENTYNLIKLDTATGRVWQVQYRMGTTDSMVIAIDDDSLLWSWEDEIPGRYELYPTQNINTFILLDTKKGYTYQVQWSTKGSDYRFRERLY